MVAIPSVEFVLRDLQYKEMEIFGECESMPSESIIYRPSSTTEIVTKIDKGNDMMMAFEKQT